MAKQLGRRGVCVWGAGFIRLPKTGKTHLKRKTTCFFPSSDEYRWWTVCVKICAMRNKVTYNDVARSRGSFRTADVRVLFENSFSLRTAAGRVKDRREGRTILFIFFKFLPLTHKDTSRRKLFVPTESLNLARYSYARFFVCMRIQYSFNPFNGHPLIRRGRQSHDNSYTTAVVETPREVL